MFKWTVYIVTTSGNHVPHWSDTTRARARAYLRGMGKLPAGVRGYVAKTDATKGWAY